MRIAPWSDPVLEDITRAIVDGFHPSRIVLFGSRARGDSRDDSDYDLMVELDSTRGALEVRREVDSALSSFRASVDVKIRRPGEFEQRRDDPGTIDYDIAREGLILHPEGVRGSVIPRTTSRVREPEPGTPKSVAVWLERADEDRRIVEQLLLAAQPAWGGIAFHAQQAAEKHLKALLVSQWRKPPRTHSLALLVDTLRSAGCVLPDVARECETLKPYSVDVRYPEDQVVPTENEGRAAVGASARIVDVVRARLPG